MKELSIEEKAKAYEEALKQIKECIPDENGFVTIYPNEIFPELEESEDERIRKKIIQLVNDAMATNAPYKKEMLAWLEKQGEQEQDINIQINPSEYINDMGGNGCYLKNVTQVSAWSEEDEEMFDAVIANIQFTQKTHNHEVNQIVYEREIDWLKSLKERVHPKQEWKQENTGDLTDFENAMMHIGGSFFGKHAGLDPNDTNAIKEQANLLLELVPKQEWSEENQCMLNNVIDTLKPLSQTTHSGYAINSMIDWLKSLRPQNTWKPSDEQMYNLSEAAHYNSAFFSTDVLIGLYDDLKKLREE